MNTYKLVQKDISTIKEFFEYNNYSIRSLQYLIEYLNNSTYIQKQNMVNPKYIKNKLTLFNEIYQDKLWYHEKDEYYYGINNILCLNMTLIYEHINKFIKNGLIVDNNKKYKNFLEPTIEYMTSLDNDYYITAYISNSMKDIAGYYTVSGKIYYDEYDYNRFDYYSIKAWTRKQVQEYRHRIIRREHEW